MNTAHTSGPQGTKIDRRIVLSGLWASMVFVFAYVDILTFWRSDAIHGALAGMIPNTGIVIDQTFLALSVAYIAVPTLMVAASLLVPARANRMLNLTVSVLYAISIGVALIGEGWLYFIGGSIIELVLLATIAGTAWSWRTRPGAPARPERLARAGG